jgi:hypothetical protein
MALPSTETSTNATSITTTGSTSSDATAGGKSAAAAQQQQQNNDSAVFSDSERERKTAGPMSWIRGKIQERKDKDAEKRSRTPDRVGSSTSQIFQHERSKSRPDLQASQQHLPEVSNADASVTDHRLSEQNAAQRSISNPKAQYVTDAAQSTPPQPIVASTWMAPAPLISPTAFSSVPGTAPSTSTGAAPTITNSASAGQTTWMPVSNPLQQIPEVAIAPPTAEHTAGTAPEDITAKNASVQ